MPLPPCPLFPAPLYLQMGLDLAYPMRYTVCHIGVAFGRKKYILVHTIAVISTLVVRLSLAFQWNVVCGIEFLSFRE